MDLGILELVGLMFGKLGFADLEFLNSPELLDFQIWIWIYLSS